jgi:hypothetical protein
MATTKVGFQLASSLASKHLTDAEFIKGSYFVVSTVAERDGMTVASSTVDGTIVVGSLCYCADTKKFYQYTATGWAEKSFGPEVDDLTSLG